MRGGSEQNDGGCRRRVSKEGKRWGSRNTRMGFLMFVIRLLRSMQKGLIRDTRNTEQIKGSESERRSVLSDSVTPWTIQSMELSRPEYWVGSLSLLQGIFPTQGWNPGLLHCRLILYQLSHKRSPRILEWVPYPFSSRSPQPRNQTGVPALQADSLPTELPGEP